MSPRPGPFGRLGRLLTGARPPEVDEVLTGAPGEHLLAWALDTAGAPLVATDRGLWGYGDRLAWDEIDQVRWADGVLHLLALDGEPREVPLGDERDLPAVVRAQVEASVVHSRHVPLRPDAKGVLVVARRITGDGSGRTEWRQRFDAGVDADDPATRAAADQAARQVRSDLGL